MTCNGVCALCPNPCTKVVVERFNNISNFSVPEVTETKTENAGTFLVKKNIFGRLTAKKVDDEQTE